MDLRDTRQRLRAATVWRADPPAYDPIADDSGWFRDPALLAALGPALASLHPDAATATVVMGTESRGTALALLVGLHLGVGVAEVRKEPERASDDDKWLTQRTAPDYMDRHLDLAVRSSLLRAGDRVLFVDDWIDTGAQAAACRSLVDQADATWLGAHVIVDSLTDSAARRRLMVRSLLNLRDL